MPPIAYCDDAMLAYRSARRIFLLGEGTVFDEAYRLAHLPLVNAEHPAVISEVDGRDYRNGTYEKTRYALVMSIPAEDILRPDEFQALEGSMESASFAPKIAWELCERRRSRLHATRFQRACMRKFWPDSASNRACTDSRDRVIRV